MMLEERATITRSEIAPIGILGRGYEAEGAELLPGYTVHVGLWSKRPHLHAKKLERKGPFLIVVHNGRPVACGRLGHLFVRDEHRGKGIGSRVYAEIVRRWPDVVEAHYAKGIHVTPGGEASVRRAWAMLEAERGNA